MNITIITLITAIIIWGQMKEENPEPNSYCDMVELGVESGGEYGWPDYKNIYNTECKGESK